MQLVPAVQVTAQAFSKLYQTNTLHKKGEPQYVSAEESWKVEKNGKFTEFMSSFSSHTNH